MESVKSIQLSRTLHFFILEDKTMIKVVTYTEYQVLKVIGHDVRIIKADDKKATIVIK